MAGRQPGSFGDLLSRYRTALGLSQEELAEQAGLSARGVSDLERGARTRPHGATVRQLADALHLAPDDRALLLEAAQQAREPAAPPAPSSSAPGSFLGALPPGPLVGREDEMSRIRAALQAVTEGTGQLLLLVGELGVGKTRLAQEVTAELRERDGPPAKSAKFLVGTGRCYQRNQQTPYVPLLEAFSELMETGPAGVRRGIKQRWQNLRHGVDTVLANSAASRASQFELATAVTDFVTALADVTPVAIVLDDLHWADDGTVGLVQRLARETRAKPVFLLVTLRDSHLSEDHPLLAQTVQDLARERLAERIIVRRLSAEETARLAAGYMGEETLAEDFAAYLYRRTKGIPRFVEGMIQALGGRLELHGEIGAGAMGRVFAAYDARTDQEVAAKLMLTRGEVELDTLLRFQHEAAVLTKLRHPGIVEIYDSFIDEHASCIIMELLEGESVGQMLQEGPLSLTRSKGLVLQVADALSYAHSQQIVHRDIKPDNVMVLDGDQVKVTDFGIARILQPDTSLHTIATTGMRMGTPLYMAPEQIEGKQIDGRTDIYALGCMLYHMVTGRPPFEGSDALAVAVKHLQEEPVPPSRINPDIPADWDALILKAMAKDPAKRFQSATDMGDAIDRLRETADPQRATAARPWWGVASVVLGIIVVIALVAGAWMQTTRGSHTAGPVSQVDAYLTQHHFSGYILLERHGQVLLSKGYGMADTKAHLPNTVRSKWPALGTSRLMTAIAILRLQDQRKLTVHDAACRYITGCPRSWRRMTIHQLLLETAGLGTVDTAHVPGGVGQALARCKALPVAAVGTISTESRCSKLVLDTIIVNVTGKSWAAAMQALVFSPARMTDSGQLTSTVTPPERVQGYSAGVPVPLDNYNNYYTAYASFRDLERMDRALLSGRLLSRGALHMLFTPYVSGASLLPRYPTSTHTTQLAACYECYLRSATAATVTVADNPGVTGSFSIDDAVSPDDGTIAIIAQNDSSGPGLTDVLFGLGANLLWNKQRTAPSHATRAGNRIAAYLRRARYTGYFYAERHGQVILSRGFGMADAKDRVPNTLQTTWPAFALSRFLQGVAIMRLQEEGKLSVQDRVCRYVSACPAAWRPMTIKELLTMTSGMAEYFALESAATLGQNMAACRASPLLSPPGTAPSPWSDCNTLVLATILEKVTGKRWADAMRELVFGPAGMTGSGRMANALKPPRRGQLYRAGSPTPDLNYDGFYLAYTTGQDIIRFNHALLAGKLLSPRSLDTMFAPLVHDDPSDPNSPWRGYEVISRGNTATTYGGVCESCINGGGEDDEGNRSGLFMPVGVSRGAGTIELEIVNDTAYFTSDDDNRLASFVSKPLYGM